MPDNIQQKEPISEQASPIEPVLEKMPENAAKQSALDEYVEKAISAVQLLPIDGNLSAAKIAKFKKMNERLIAATKKRATAEFREKELRLKAEKAKVRAAASGEKAAVRRRREHLCFTLGAYDLSNGLANKSVNINYVMSMLLTMENAQKFNKLKSELMEFLPFLAQNAQFTAAKFQKPQKEKQNEKASQKQTQ